MNTAYQYITPEHEMIRKVIREFAVNEIEPYAEEIDKQHRFPREILQKMYDCGIVGLMQKPENGGCAWDRLSAVIVVEEISRASLSVGATLAINFGGSIVNAFGSEEQRKRFAWTRERMTIYAFGLTEPGVGSDAAGVATTAVRDGDEWVINGTKCFNTGTGEADLYTIIAQTDRSKGAAGMVCLLVEPGTPGFTIGKIEDKMGIRGSVTGELIFEDCRVPVGNQIGQVGQAFKIAMSELTSARVCTAAQAVGVAQAALDLAVKYAGERKQFGTTLDSFQGIRWYIAEMATKLEAARLLTYNAAWLDQTKQPVEMQAAMAKLYASQIAREVVNTSLQIHGGYGYVTDYAIERLYRDVKITEIYEGTSEIMKTVIASNVIPRRAKKAKK